MASLRFSLGGYYNLFTHTPAQRMMWNVMGSPMSAHLRKKRRCAPALLHWAKRLAQKMARAVEITERRAEEA